MIGSHLSDTPTALLSYQLCFGTWGANISEKIAKTNICMDFGIAVVTQFSSGVVYFGVAKNTLGPFVN